MFSELKRLLHPFRAGFAWYVVFTLIRQGLVVGGGYGLVLLIRRYEHRPGQSALLALAVLIGYKLVLDTVDQLMGWNFAKHVSYPMFRQLSVNVFAKLMSLDQGWHQAGSSGRRRGEITNGLSKFAQTSESLAREVCPLLATALLSLFLLRNYAGPLFCSPFFREPPQCSSGFRTKRIVAASVIAKHATSDTRPITR